MVTEKLRVLLVAEESAGLQTLKMITNGPHELVGVLASPSHGSKAATVWDAAVKLDAPVLPAESVKDDAFAQTVLDLNVDVLLNVHSLYLIRGSILEACKLGAYNMHPGPLPHYAGLNVPSWAIYYGERQHAVTVHEMTAEIDAGTIAYDAWFPIEERDNGFSVMAKCVRAGVPLLEQLLDAAATEMETGKPTVPRRAQDFSRRRYFGKKAPNAGQIDWNWPAADVVNHVRASDYSPFTSPWGAPEAWLVSDPFGVSRATLTGEGHDGVAAGTVGPQTDKGVLVACADEWIEVRKLRIDDVSVDAADVLAEGDVLTRTPLVPACI
jgi:methionyl-tRNA formyltransferase